MCWRNVVGLRRERISVVCFKVVVVVGCVNDRSRCVLEGEMYSSDSVIFKIWVYI